MGKSLVSCSFLRHSVTNTFAVQLLLWFLILKTRYVALDSVDNSNDCKKWLVDLTIVSVWYSSVVLL